MEDRIHTGAKKLDQRDVGGQGAIEEWEQIDADTHKQGVDR